MGDGSDGSRSASRDGGDCSCCFRVVASRLWRVGFRFGILSGCLEASGWPFFPVVGGGRRIFCSTARGGISSRGAKSDLLLLGCIRVTRTHDM